MAHNKQKAVFSLSWATLYMCNEQKLNYQQTLHHDSI